MVTPVISTDSYAISRRQQLAADGSNFFVVPDSRTLTAWLLLPQVAEVVPRLMALQVHVAQISPYQPAGCELTAQYSE